jgi:hypothetical protein
MSLGPSYLKDDRLDKNQHPILTVDDGRYTFAELRPRVRTARTRFSKSHVDISVARQGVQWDGRGRDLQSQQEGREKRERRGRGEIRERDLD